MPHSLAKAKALKPPKELAQLFADPPLALNEKREDYDELFTAIAAAARPADAIAWLLVRDFTDLSWEIQRERKLKAQIIKSAEEEIVAERLTPPTSQSLFLVPFGEPPEPSPAAKQAMLDARQWATDPKQRRRIERELADRNCQPADILSGALISKAFFIDAIDRRIASCELRRMATLKMIEQYSETLARRLKVASSEVIDGEFTEAAE